MKIKVCRVEDGPAKVEIIDGEGVTQSCTEVNAGQEVELTIPGASSAEDIQVGEITETQTETDPDPA